MATNQKLKPCPKCRTSEFLGVYAYESGWRYVECDKNGCWYRGPGEGSVRQAIKSHNAKSIATLKQLADALRAGEVGE